MKSKVKTKYVFLKYRFISIDTWKSVKEEGLVKRFMKDKESSFSTVVEALNPEDAIIKWKTQYHYPAKSIYIKESFSIDEYDVLLFSYYRGSRYSSYRTSSTVSQKMVMIEFI